MTTAVTQPNPLAIKPRQLLQLLSKMIPARLPLLVVGKPGVGKTDLVKHAAHEAKAHCLLTHPIIKDPTDYKGMPTVYRENGISVADFIPFGDLRAMMEATEPTVVFFDDLGQGSQAVQAALMQLILAREIDGKKISEYVTFIGATNRRGDRAGVSGILEPVKSRFSTIVELEADVKDWINWAIGAGIPPQVIAYIRLRPEMLSQFTPTNDLVNSPSPRTWKNLADQVALNHPVELRLPVYSGSVGEACAAEYCTFERTWASMVSPDLVLSNPQGAPIPTEPSALYALTTALAYRVTKDSMARYVTYMDRLIAQNLGEFAARSMQAAVTRDQALVNTGAYIHAMAGALGKLMIGE